MLARGGYGATRIVERLPWEDFARAPKWIVGFSDATALHCAALARGVASVHAPNVTGLARPDVRTRASWLARARAAGGPGRLVQSCMYVVAGDAEGSLFGGNLALVQAVAAAGALPSLEGAIVVLEDVTERPYRVDRMLTSLAPHLARARAVVFGSFTQCEPGADGVTVEEVLARFARGARVPVLAGAPFGHGEVNDAFVLGAPARVEGDRLVIGARI